MDFTDRVNRKFGYFFEVVFYDIDRVLGVNGLFSTSCGRFVSSLVF